MFGFKATLHVDWVSPTPLRWEKNYVLLDRKHAGRDTENQPKYASGSRWKSKAELADVQTLDAEYQNY